MFLKFLEVLLIMLAFIMIITQMLIPAITSRPWFPLFRNSSKLDKQMGYKKQQLQDRQVEQQIKRLDDELQSDVAPTPVDVDVTAPPKQ